MGLRLAARPLFFSATKKEIEMTSGARVWAEEGCPAPKKEPKTVQVPQRDMTAALSDVIAERRRQIDAEGWSTEHDDEHLPGELSLIHI